MINRRNFLVGSAAVGASLLGTNTLAQKIMDFESESKFVGSFSGKPFFGANGSDVFDIVVISVSDETGGHILAFSDGTNWRRVTDNAIVS